MIYDIGDTVRCTGNFYNTSDVLADPTTVLFKTKDPAATLATLTYGTDAALVKDSTGVYHVDVLPTVEGTWYYRFEGTGTVNSAEEGVFVVQNSQFY